MIKNKAVWLGLNAFIVAFWLAAIVMLLSGHPTERLVLIAAVVLVAHVLEMPLAFLMLRGRNVAAGRIILMNLIFGFTWWLPVRRGIYAA